MNETKINTDAFCDFQKANKTIRNKLCNFFSVMFNTYNHCRRIGESKYTTETVLKKQTKQMKQIEDSEEKGNTCSQ